MGEPTDPLSLLSDEDLEDRLEVARDECRDLEDEQHRRREEAFAKAHEGHGDECPVCKGMREFYDQMVESFRHSPLFSLKK